MRETSTTIFHFSIRFLPFFLAAVIALLGCSESPWEPPHPGAVIAEHSSPDKSLLARIIAGESQGAYIFEVRDVRINDVLAKRAIVVPVGYHSHIALLKWSDDGRIVTVTIDHDFGENNKEFHIRIKRLGA